MAKVYPLRENAHIQMYLLLPLLNLIYINVITYCIIKKNTVAVDGPNIMKILPYGFSWKCLRTINADCSGDTAKVLTELIPFSEPCVGVKSVIDQT